MLVKDALNYGKISNGNTKMPGTTYAVDAFACKVGSKLRNIPGSICSKCYTIKLQKLRPSVDQGYKTNLLKWVNRSSSKDWVDAIVFQINIVRMVIIGGSMVAIANLWKCSKLLMK